MRWRDINAQQSAVIFPWLTIRFEGDHVAHWQFIIRQNAATITACIPWGRNFRNAATREPLLREGHN
jgi:hypothetical protein